MRHQGGVFRGQPEFGPDRRRPFHEELDRFHLSDLVRVEKRHVPAEIGCGERGKGPEGFPLDVQRLAAAGNDLDLRAIPQECRDDLRATRDEVLAVIEDE